MEFKPTAQQSKAINACGQVLVSAAAGSGKTAVLVEKVAKLIINNEISADKLLIVTFTNAAAAELRSRIDLRLQDEIQKDGYNIKLQEQQMLLNSAYIGTIDSICIRLVREYFDVLGVSPEFNIIENSDFIYLQNNIIKDILKEKYEKQDKDFINLLSLFPSEIDDSKIISIILDFYKTISIEVYPQLYLNKIKEMYEIPDFMHWFAPLNKEIASEISSISSKLFACLKELENESKLKPIITKYTEYLNSLVWSLNNNNYTNIYNALHNPYKPTFPGKSKLVPEETLTKTKAFKKEADAILKELKKEYSITPNLLHDSYSKIKSSIFALLDITEKMLLNLKETLIEKNLLTFELAERLSLSLLKEYKDNNIITTKYASEIINKFSVVMVDEYQDTNDLQDYIFMSISDEGKNLYVVGDIKQSIYRFRGANPLNFKKKQVTYKDIDELSCEQAKKIYLTNNFRSRKEICDFINYFFKGRMTEEVGSIDYIDNEMLSAKAEFPENSASKTDIVLLNKDKDKTNVITEAEYIASYILNTMQEAPFLKDKDGGLRKAEYKDFAILLRTDLGNMDLFGKVFAEYNIPFSLSGNSPLTSSEVVTVISLLRAVNQKSDYISLISALTSPLFGFTVEEVAQLKLSYSKNIYLALKIAAKNNDLKAQNAIKLLDKIKNSSNIMSVGELISTILDETKFREIVLSFNNGKTRYNNLALLEELAFDFDKSENYSLYSFLQYFDKIADNYSKDKKPDKNENTVKIMTMHKSKGLQFPICIVALNYKHFSSMDSRQDFLSNGKLGVGFKYYDTESNNKVVTPAYSAILKSSKLEQISEEMRVYYVALTRAEEKLAIILTDDFNSKISNSDFLSKLNKNNSFSCWVLDAVFKSADSNKIRDRFDLPLIENSNGNMFNLIYVDDLKFNKKPKQAIKNDVIDNTLVDLIENRFSYKYPYEKLTKLISKTSVSNIISNKKNSEHNFASLPAFIEGERLTASQKGTALHKFMQLTDYNAAKINLNDEIERLKEYKYLSSDEISSLNIDQITAFFNSDILKRISKSNKVYREYRFLSEISGDTIDDSLEESLKNTPVIIQGAVDCLFIENNEIVILDFKTDRIKDDATFIDLYKEQLNYYSLACEKIFGLKVKEQYIYSLYNKKEILIK